MDPQHRAALTEALVRLNETKTRNMNGIMYYETLARDLHRDNISCDAQIAAINAALEAK